MKESSSSKRPRETSSATNKSGMMTRIYPKQYVRPWKMTDGTEVIIRPICPDDEPLMVWFHETLSDETVYLRYFHPMKLSKRVSHERLTRICDVDYETEMVLVAECETSSPREQEIIAVSRMNRLPDSDKSFPEWRSI